MTYRLRCIGGYCGVLYKHEQYKILHENEHNETMNKINFINFYKFYATEDFIKLQAAAEVVRGFQRIEDLRKKEMEMTQEGKTPKEIAEVTKLRTAELKSVIDFCKDNGFSEKYGINKNKGVGTLTGMMNEMKNSYYEDGLVNYYNVKTCKEMQEAADMSMEAVFKQLNLGENETYTMIQTQTKRIMALQKELDDTKEQLRLKEVELKEAELIERAKADGSWDEDLDEEDEEEIPQIPTKVGE